MNKHTRGGQRLAGATALLIVSGLTSSCMSIEEYDAALALTKQYQTDKFNPPLLRSELTKFQVQGFF